MGHNPGGEGIISVKSKGRAALGGSYVISERYGQGSENNENDIARLDDREESDVDAVMREQKRNVKEVTRQGRGTKK